MTFVIDLQLAMGNTCDCEQMQLEYEYEVYNRNQDKIFTSNTPITYHLTICDASFYVAVVDPQ